MDKYQNQYNYQKTEKGLSTQKKYLQSDKGKEKQRKYKQSEKGIKNMRINNWKKRGILSDDYDKVYDEYIKTTHCKLCNHEFINSTERCLDHCHQTGKIRNIICRSCNTRDYRPVYNKKEAIKNKRIYQETWGGRTDCLNNSLLKIETNLFD